MFGKIKIFSPLGIFLLQIALVGSIIISLIPRELYALWALFLVGYFLWERIDRAFLFFVASLPLFMAMPLAPALDTINVWRVLVIILFLKLVYIKFKAVIRQAQDPERSRETVQSSKLYVLIGILLVLVLFSIFLNDAPATGIKRLIFFLNIFALVPVVRYLTEHQDFLPRLARSVGISLGLILLVGYLQLAGVFVIPIDQFIGWWAHHVTKTYYGGRLNEYIMLDNNWFTYEPGSIPTLRMFSIFHESHALGLYTILTLPFIGYLYKTKNEKRKSWKSEDFTAGAPSRRRAGDRKNYNEENAYTHDGLAYSVRHLLFSKSFITVFTLPLLAIVLTGTRGLWISAAGAVGFWFSLWLRRAKGLALEARFFSAILLLLAMLFFVGSFLGFFEQKAQSFSSGAEDIGVALNRLKSAFDLEEASNQGRLGIWKQTLPAVLRQPLLGVGLGNFGAIMGNTGNLRFSAHNLYLHIAAELGIPALFIIFVIVWVIAREGWLSLVNSSTELWARWYVSFSLFSFSWLLVASVFDVTLLDQRALILFVIGLTILWGIAVRNPRVLFGAALVK